MHRLTVQEERRCIDSWEVVHGMVRCGRRTCGCIKRGEATPVTRGGSMPSIRFPRAIGNLLLFLLSVPHSRPPRTSLAVSLGLMHITPRALTFAICSHARMRPLLGSHRRRTTLAGPTTLLGDGDTPSCRRIIGAVHLAQCSGREEKEMRAASRKRIRDSFDPPAKTRARFARETTNTIGQILL